MIFIKGRQSGQLGTAHTEQSVVRSHIVDGTRRLREFDIGDQSVNFNFIVRVWGIGIKPDGLGRNEIERYYKKGYEG